MGCDIHVHAEYKKNGKWIHTDEIFTPDDYDIEQGESKMESPFYWRRYIMFALFADVRNRHDIKPISRPRGIPSGVSSQTFEDATSWLGNSHSHSWLSLKDLLEVDYDQLVEDEEDETVRPLRDCLGDIFFVNLNELSQLADEDKESIRIVFWFDN